jgi:hypothetical protein
MNPYLAKLQALEQTGPIGGIVSFVGSQSRPISEFENSKIATSANRQNRQNLFWPAFEALKRQRPAHVDVADWQIAIEDGGIFLRRWAEQAEALGWTARDVFGLAPAPDKVVANYRRLSRYDLTGLIWLLRGRPVVALTEATAAIQHRRGSVTTYRRHNKPALGPVGDSLDDMRTLE